MLGRTCKHVNNRKSFALRIFSNFKICRYAPITLGWKPAVIDHNSYDYADETETTKETKYDHNLIQIGIGKTRP